MIQTKRLTIAPLTYKELLRHVFGRKGSVITEEDELWAVDAIVKPTHYADGDDYLYSTIWTATDKDGYLIGDIWLKGLPTDFGLVEIADFIVPKYRSNGYCTEMVGGFLGWVEQDERINFIVASVEESNIASKMVFLKNGLKPIGYNEGRCTFIKQLKF